MKVRMKQKGYIRGIHHVEYIVARINKLFLATRSGKPFILINSEHCQHELIRESNPGN